MLLDSVIIPYERFPLKEKTGICDGKHGKKRNGKQKQKNPLFLLLVSHHSVFSHHPHIAEKYPSSEDTIFIPSASLLPFTR